VIADECRTTIWTELGRVTEPGRYGFSLGFVFITAEDLAIWEKYPDAAFTLIPLFSSGPKEGYRLGAFDLSSPSIG
jgi:hypothetical protein